MKLHRKYSYFGVLFFLILCFSCDSNSEELTSVNLIGEWRSHIDKSPSFVIHLFVDAVTSGIEVTADGPVDAMRGRIDIYNSNSYDPLDEPWTSFDLAGEIYGDSMIVFNPLAREKVIGWIEIIDPDKMFVVLNDSDPNAVTEWTVTKR